MHRVLALTACVLLGVQAQLPSTDPFDLSAITNFTDYEIDPQRCVSPSGYESCVAPIAQQFQICLNNAAGDTTQISGCAYAGLLFILSCAHENCWNIVYSCDVQEVASLVVQSGPYGPPNIPYYPAPEGGELGQCSCNLEAVQYAVVTALDALAFADMTSLDNIYAATCCSQAGAYAGLFEICPDVNPEYLLQTLPGYEILLTAYTPQFSECGQYLQQYNCENDLNYPALAISSSLAYLSTIPISTGTLSYSDLPGEVPTPEAAVLTYTPNSVALTVTAASAGNIGQGGGATPSTTAEETGDAAAESTGEATASSSITSGTRKGVKSGPAISAVAILAFIVIIA